MTKEVGITVRTNRNGVNHRRLPQAKKLLCGKPLRVVKELLDPDPDTRLCVGCKRALEVMRREKRKRRYHMGRKDAGKMPRRGRREDGLPHFFSKRVFFTRRHRRRIARESRRRNR